MVFATRSEGGVWTRIPAQDVAKPLSAMCLIPLWLSACESARNRFGRGKKAGTRATPPPKHGGGMWP